MTTNRPSTAPLRFAGAIRTDVGCVRQINEDSVAFIASAGSSQARDPGALALVADGMGGHAAGEVASALALEVVRRVYYSLDKAPAEALRAAFDAANRAIFDYAAKHPECAGMGTTCTALGVRDNRLWLAHVGDSRAYLMRAGRLTQLSDDQTLHAQLVRDGVMSPEDAGKGAGSNVILQALGTRLDVEPTIWMEGLPLQKNDIAILCSDGLTNLVADARIAEAVSKYAPAEACRLLIEAAREGGGHDNISVGVFVAETDDSDRIADQAETKRIKIADPPVGGRTAKIDAIIKG